MATIKLGLAERQVINIMLTNLPEEVKSNVDTARMVRAVYKALDLGGAARAVNALQEDARKLGVELPGWDDILEKSEPVEYEIDSTVLSWLRDRLQQHDFSKMKVAGQGQARWIEVVVPIAQHVAIANLADAIAEALS